ncbi:MAG: type III pantothenate kinase [Candidatus Kapaibacterium sp.]|jgi:type III pantothenate kinase
MLLTVDIGNTSTKFGLFDSSELKRSDRLATSALVAHSHTEPLQQIFESDAAYSKIKAIAVASVVPIATQALVEYCSAHFPAVNVTEISHANIPLINSYNAPTDVGLDRLLSAFAAYMMYGKPALRPVITVDTGTATTFNCVTSKGEFLGGAITLGAGAIMKALHSSTAQLPIEVLEFPSSSLGRSTDESIRSGVLFGSLAMIEGMIERLKLAAFFDEDPIVILTGGHSNLFRGKSLAFDQVEPHLVLFGIRLSYESQMKQ